MSKKLFVLGLIYLAWGWWMTIPSSQVKVIFCNVGQGDAALVTSGYFQMLVDTGSAKGGVEKCLDENIPLGDKKIEVVLLSHWDSDHAGAIENLKKTYEIKKIVSLGDVFNGDKIIGLNWTFSVLYPDMGLKPRENDSIVGILKYDDRQILFTGDIDELVEKSIVDRVTGTIDIVKLSHHGSKTGNSEDWLRRINANFAVISVGKNNYGHPNADVIGRVLGVGTSVLRTDKNGSLLVE